MRLTTKAMHSRFRLAATLLSLQVLFFAASLSRDILRGIDAAVRPDEYGATTSGASVRIPPPPEAFAAGWDRVQSLGGVMVVSASRTFRNERAVVRSTSARVARVATRPTIVNGARRGA